MKLISLNIWGGTLFKPLLEFIRSAAPTTDVFCFQEVFRSGSDVATSGGARMNIFADLVKALPDFDAYFAATQDQYDLKEPIAFSAAAGEALFIRRSVPVASHGERFVYGSFNDVVITSEGPDWPSAAQFVRIDRGGEPLTIVNIHGIAYPGAKVDTPARLEQSRNIAAFLNGETGEKVLCGDFNLMPETESVRLIEETGMRNLIKEFGISSTRGSVNAARYPADDLQHFADYAFVSPGIKVGSFTVPNVDISDHLPLILEFS